VAISLLPAVQLAEWNFNMLNCSVRAAGLLLFSSLLLPIFNGVHECFAFPIDEIKDS
jgi:hypothetical protein